ncbi:MAG: helix-turn-helix transcriptional regulator [Bacteroidota bacterium]|nr:MAG: helix-turn-helix transcriptional regulator [Bacteroidota bacterium]
MISEFNVDQLNKAAAMLKAISHPLRIAILNQLEAGKQLTVTEIHEALNIEQSTASHHLGILRDKDVLIARRDGKNTFYSLKHQRINTLIECINKCACD